MLILRKKEAGIARLYAGGSVSRQRVFERKETKSRTAIETARLFWGLVEDDSTDFNYLILSERKVVEKYGNLTKTTASIYNETAVQ